MVKETNGEVKIRKWKPLMENQQMHMMSEEVKNPDMLKLKHKNEKNFFRSCNIVPNKLPVISEQAQEFERKKEDEQENEESS